MKLTKKQQDVLASNNHLLVTGGPGSGKTTVSIFKAASLLESELESYQKVLFLSFARASVSRVVEAIEHEHNIDPLIKKRIDVDTYHSFFWRILKTHGYLIGLPRLISVLTPQREAIALSGIRSSFPSAKLITDKELKDKKQQENNERYRLLYQEGFVGFDYFAIGVSEILNKSQKIRNLIATKYPVIIFDEFQDTSEGQWLAVKGLGVASRMISLADPEQRIYDWIGANPKRLQQFRDQFQADEIDFEQNNHRSVGTEIADFGNEILSGKFTKTSYAGVSIKAYEPNKIQAYTELVSRVLAAIKRVKKSNSKGWSVAVLVPTKKMTRLISEVLDNPPNPLPAISHEPYIEVEAAMLSAEVISFLMQPQENREDLDVFISLMVNYFRGRGGEKPSKKDMTQAFAYEKALDEYHFNLSKGKSVRRNSILVNTIETYKQINQVKMSGNPEADWKSISLVMRNGRCDRLKQLSEDAKNIRLLKRGEKIRQDFGLDWRQHGAYLNALAITRLAFVQQHFANKSKLEQGVLLMNMHKAKGKQFDEVIIFEDWPKRKRGQIVGNSGRIVWSNSHENINDQSKQNFRVSVTRAKSRTTILTPKWDPCVLLL
tara:strand:+ start:11578 stop:13389 length:1812 start_codon:yes stop_codon:yes gene_type:complete